MTDPFSATSLCPGPLDFAGRSRRGFLRFGLGGFASLPLPALLNLRLNPCGRVRRASRYRVIRRLP